MNTITEKNISDLIEKLGDRDVLIRQHARQSLMGLGELGVPALLDALDSENIHRRLEAVHALGNLRDPRIALVLSNKLMDEDYSIRWAAMDGLVNQGHDVSLRPMLEVFIKHFDSVWLREGVHHVLRMFKGTNQLNHHEIELFNLLDKKEISGLETSWTGQAAWAAEKVLEALDSENRT